MSAAMPTAAAPPAFTRLSNGEDLAAIVRPEEGLVSRRIFADPEVYALELERIFGRAWFFLGHDSEIPNPGDAVTRVCGVTSSAPRNTRISSVNGCPGCQASSARTRTMATERRPSRARSRRSCSSC